MVKASELASPSATKAILDRFDLAPKKAFGQNFLVNDGIIQKIMNLSEVSFGDVVLEVGPGIGTLTTALLKNASYVIAVERDPDLPEVLSYTLQKWEGKYQIIKKDALDLQSEDLEHALHELSQNNTRGLNCDTLDVASATASNGVSDTALDTTSGGALNAASKETLLSDALSDEVAPNKFVANLPYSVAATLVLDYFWRFRSLQSATVMVQKEVADRMMADVGTKNYGAYTIKLSMIAEPRDMFLVKPDNFMPRPHVDSAVIRLDRISHPSDDRRLVDIACIMADAAFASRRKTISNSMRTYLSGVSSGTNVKLCSRMLESLPELFEIADIDPKIRGERLSKHDYLNLARVFCESFYEL